MKRLHRECCRTLETDIRIGIDCVRWHYAIGNKLSKDRFGVEQSDISLMGRLIVYIFASTYSLSCCVTYISPHGLFGESSLLNREI